MKEMIAAGKFSSKNNGTSNFNEFEEITDSDIYTAARKVQECIHGSMSPDALSSDLEKELWKNSSDLTNYVKSTYGIDIPEYREIQIPNCLRKDNGVNPKSIQVEPTDLSLINKLKLLINDIEMYGEPVHGSISINVTFKTNGVTRKTQIKERI